MDPLGPVSWKRMSDSIAKVRERLYRAARALEQAGVPYSVVGGNAVAAWVSRVDESAVRNTQDVDLLVRRSDFARVQHALESVGFVYKKAAMLGRPGVLEMFLDGPKAKARDAVHIVFAHEKVTKDSVTASPGVEESEDTADFRLSSLEALVQMKLTSYRRKDQVHLLDMIAVGLIDVSWLDRVPPLLRGRLQALLDDPEG